MDKSWYKKQSSWGTSYYYRILEKTSITDGVFEGYVALKSPFYGDTKLATTGARTYISGTFDEDTSKLAGTVKVGLSTVNLNTEYGTFYTTIADTWTVRSYVSVIVGYQGVNNHFTVVGTSGNILASEYTLSSQVATPTTAAPTLSYSMKLLLASNRVTHIRVMVETKVYDANNHLRLRENGILECPCNLYTFFTTSGTESLATMMTSTDGLTLGLQVNEMFDYSNFGMVTPETYSTLQNVRDYFGTAGSATAIVSFLTPELGANEFLVLTVNTTGLTATDFLGANAINRESLVGYGGSVPHTNTDDPATERLAYSKDEQGHRGLPIILINNAKGWSKVANSFSSRSSIINKSDGDITQYKYWFQRLFMMQPTGKRTYIPIGGLLPATSYTFRLHVAKFSTDSSFSWKGVSLWSTDYNPHAEISLSPDSGTYWVDGTHKLWASATTDAPAGFWSNRAYRKLWLYPSIVIDSNQTSATETTPPSEDIDERARPLNPTVNIVDNDLTADPTSVVLTWQTDITATQPDSWYACVSIPRYNFSYNWNVSSDVTVNDPHPKISSMVYDISSDSNYNYHSVTVNTYQSNIDLDVSFCILGRVEGWIY